MSFVAQATSGLLRTGLAAAAAFCSSLRPPARVARVFNINITFLRRAEKSARETILILADPHLHRDRYIHIYPRAR